MNTHGTKVWPIVLAAIAFLLIVVGLVRR